MVRVEDLNITFFHLPKNAGSSIATWLTMNACGEEYFDEFRHATPQGLEPLFDDFGWSFCCVRNPWDRYVSWYNFFRGQDKVHTCFNDWMTAVISGNYSAKYIKPMDNQLRIANHVDYVIKYENLEEDFKLIQQKKYFLPNLENIKTTENILGSFDIDRIELETILFQTKYLTITKTKKISVKKIYE